METNAVIVNEANRIINDFIVNTAGVLARKQWHEYSTFAEVEEALRLHRLRKKFCIIDADQAASRRDFTIRKFVTSNDRKVLDRSADWYALHANAASASFLKKARELVHSLFQDVKYTYRPVASSRSVTYVEKQRVVTYHNWKRRFNSRRAELILGPGEQYLSSGGDVSHVSKIHHHKWTVTRGAEPMAKQAVKRHRAWRRVVQRDGLRLLRAHKVTRGGLSLTEWAQLVFEAGWRNRVVVVPGSRLATVPKNNDVDRLINVEPLLNVGLQKWLGQLLEQALEKVGISLDRNQKLHGLLVQQPEKYATLDFSAASDSYGVGLVKYLFPEFVTLELMKVRSNTFEYMIGDECPRERANVYACMGNGTTFAVLTIVVWALATASAGEHCPTYGDDLIVPLHAVPRVRHAFDFCGFTVNWDKSFYEGPVRESCGTYTFNGEKLRSYDIKACESYADIIITANKVRRYLQWSPWTSRWFGLWAQLCNLVGKNHVGPISDWDNPKEVVPWLEVPRDVTDVGSGLLKWFHEQTGVPAQICTGVVWKQKVIATNVAPYDLALMRIGIGSEPQRHLRGEGEWVEQKFVVANDGRLLGTVNEIRRIRRVAIERYNRWFVGPSCPRDRLDRKE